RGGTDEEDRRFRRHAGARRNHLSAKAGAKIMPVWGAFLRGINLGKRQMKMAELQSCLEAAGFSEVKTILASGNVRLEADGPEAALREKLARTISEKFGFDVGVVLRSEDELKAMLASNPFGALDPNADLARHVLLFDTPLPRDIDIPSR